MNFVDTHAHLDFAKDIEDWLEGAEANGVNKIICVGTSLATSEKSVQIAERGRGKVKLYASVGIHAQDGNDEVKREKSLSQCMMRLRQMVSSSKKVAGIGECGFDFYLDGEKRVKAVERDKQFQRDLFGAQIQLAVELKLPMIIHCRNAWTETFELLSKFQKGFSDTKLNLRGVFHSWTGDWVAAQKAIDMGFYISFSGIVTFKNAPTIQAVAKRMPLSRMLLETDSPFLAPEPLRGSINEPKNVRITAEFLAKLRGKSPDMIANVTSWNAETLFKFEAHNIES